MLPHKMHPSTRPVAQRAQLMVSNFFDVLEDESFEQDCAFERALSEHPEVVAPQASFWQNEVVAPQMDRNCFNFDQRVFHTASCFIDSYDNISVDPKFDETDISVKRVFKGNRSRVFRGVVNSLNTPNTSGLVRRSFIDSAFRGEFGVESSALLAKYFQAGISEDLALNTLSCVGVCFSTTDKDDVYRVLQGKWWSTMTSFCYVARNYKVRHDFSMVKPFIDKINRRFDGFNLINASTSDGFYYQLSPWLSDCVKEGSFNPYGNGQPVFGSDKIFDRLDENVRACEDYEFSVDDIVDSVFSANEKKRAGLLLTAKNLFPIVNADKTVDAIRVISPVITLFYQLYNARSKTDALVAAWSFLERMAVEDDYQLVKAGVGWATSYIARFKPVVTAHLERAYEFLQDKVRSSLKTGDNGDMTNIDIQSREGIGSMVDFLTQLTIGAQTNARAQSFVWLISFLFTSISAAKSGIFVSFDTYSKSSKALVDRCFVLGAHGVTVSLFVVAIRHCYEMVADLFSEGVGSLWRTEVSTASELDTRGRALLSRSMTIDISTDFGEVVTYGADLDKYLRDVEANAPLFSARQLGVNVFGMGMSSETNTAILWSSIKKISSELKVAMQRYKLMLASISYKKAPFCMAAVGGSSLGKSLFTQSVASYINALLGVKHDPRLIFTYNPGSDYMDGYKPYQTIVILDDVATMRPDYCKDGDPQTKMLINMINNVSFLTPQADLPDKKTHPFLSKAVILTSNTKDFNANVYATNPAAVLRRVKYRVQLHIHVDFVNSVGGLDQTKARLWSTSQPVGEASFPPFWEYTVEELVAHNAGEDSIGFKMDVRTQKVLDKAGTQEFLLWLRESWTSHEANQDAAVQQVKELSNLGFCSSCRMPHPYHDPQCNLVVTGVVVQSLNVLDPFFVIPIDQRVKAFLGIMFAYVCTRLYSVLCKLVDGVFIVRDKSIATMALMEDASDKLSHMAITWSRIGTPAAVVIGTCGMIYSWALFGLSAAYMVLVVFPTTRVRALVNIKNTMLAASVLIAGGLLVRQLFKHNRDDKRAVQQSREEESTKQSTADFSSNDSAAKWGDGVCRPYMNDNMTVAYSSGTKTSRGASQDGVISAIQKAVFVCNILSEDAVNNYSSVGNGFVYSQNPPIIGVNLHSLTTHVGREKIKITLMFKPNTAAEPVDRLSLFPTDTYTFSISFEDVVSNIDHDLAMIYVHGLNRRGIDKFMVLDGHTHGGVGPILVGRDLYGHTIERHLSNFKFESNVMSSQGSKILKMPGAYSYVTQRPTVSGESGSLLMLHCGEAAFGEKGGVAIAGFHVGYVDASQRVVVAPLNKVVCDTLVKKAVLRRQTSYVENVPDVPAVVLQCVTEHSPHGSEDNVFDLVKASPGGLVLPHRKSAINWVEAPGAVQVFGGLTGDCRLTQGLKSGYLPTRWSNVLSHTRGSVLGDTSNVYMPTVVPRDSLWKVHHRTLKDLLNVDTNTIPDVILDNAVAGFVEDIVSNVHLSGNDARWNNFGVITLSEAINGVPGVLDSIVWKTGGGFGYNGPKLQQRVDTGVFTDLGVKMYTLQPDVMESIYAADHMLRSGIDPGFVYQTHLKDEVRTRKKVLDGKIRMICGAPIPAIVLTRKYLASLIVFMSQNPLSTECAVGVNSESKQWGDLIRFLKEYADDDRFVAGDYENFDKNQTLQMTLAVGQVMLALVLHANELYPGKYDDGDILAIRTLLSGLCYPRYDHFGTLFAICGSNPSGNSLTAQRNCIANSLYTRCSFIWLAKTCVGLSEHLARKLFTSVVRQINYGDDVVLAIRSHFGWYNHDTIAYILGVWGVPFTHADKSLDIGRPYENLSKVTFLKRAFVYNSEIGDYLAPLDVSSVVKSLHYYCPRTSASYNTAHVELLRAAAENMLSHGRQVYDEFCVEATQLASTAGLTGIDYFEAVDFPTWDSFVERWKSNSNNPKFGKFYTRPHPSPCELVGMPAHIARLVSKCW